MSEKLTEDQLRARRLLRDAVARQDATIKRWMADTLVQEALRRNHDTRALLPSPPDKEG